MGLAVAAEQVISHRLSGGCTHIMHSKIGRAGCMSTSHMTALPVVMTQHKTKGSAKCTELVVLEAAQS